MTNTAPAIPDPISEAINRWDTETRTHFKEVRKRIFAVADQHAQIGSIEETLKWGEPSYLTVRPKSGSTLRVSTNREDGRLTLFVNCQTDLIDQIKTRYPDAFDYHGKRSVVFKSTSGSDADALDHVIALVLTYHSRKRVT
ncbi:MAG: DUF1801 domain-containing protein [Pseudomonadota bacterium]